jgi:hypothetical protein
MEEGLNMSAAFPTIVYSLCLVTSLTCAGLLGRMFHRTGVRLLLWSAGCFALLALNNFVVILDMLILPTDDLQTARLVFSLAAVCLLLFGFTWERDE